MTANLLLPRIKLLGQKIKRFLGILLIFNWAILLCVHTLELQNSCNPLVGTSSCVSCVDVDVSKSFFERINPFTNGQSNPDCPEIPGTAKSPKRSLHSNDNSKSTNPSTKPNKDRADSLTPANLLGNSQFAGAFAGSVALTGAALAGAPVVVAVGIGIAVWLTAKTILSSS